MIVSVTISNELLCTMFSKWLETAKDSANKLYSVGKSVLQDVTSSSLFSRLVYRNHFYRH